MEGVSHVLSRTQLNKSSQGDGRSLPISGSVKEMK